MKRPKEYAVSVVSLLAFAAAANAQQPRQNDVPLEEVVVTAQKREQNIQEIPTTVSVVDGDLLKSFDVMDFDELDAFVPGLIFTRQPGNNFSLTMRGIGSSAGQQAFEQSVVSYIDGVYGGYQKDFSVALFDLERAEVLKGTQSGILGKNASVGAFNIITRKPGTEFGGYLEAGYELEFDSTLIEGAIDVPANKRFRVRLAGRYEDAGGFVTNQATGQEVQQIDHKTARANVVWEPSEAVTATLFAQYDDQEKFGDSSTPVTDTAGGALVALDPRFQPGVDDTILHFTGRGRGRGGEPFSVLEALRSSLTLDFEIGSHTLTSVSAYSDNEDQFALDLDFYVLDGAAFTQEATFDQFTQEVRLASDPAGRFTYIVGAFYYSLEWDRVFRSIVDPDPRVPAFAIPATRMATIPYNVQTEGVSLFGQLGLKLTDRLELGASLRGTSEDKDARIESISNFPAGLTPVPLTFESRTSEPIDWSANFTFEFTKDVLGYALVGRGTKTGAFADITNNVSINPATGRPSNEVKDEVSTTYELGLKTSWLDGAATLNGSVWHMDVEDFQESVVIAGVFLTANQDYVSDGAELQGTWQTRNGFRMSGTLTYVDARNETPPAFVPPVPPESDIPALRAPKWTANFDVLYERPLGGTALSWNLGGHVYYRDEYWNAPLISVTNFRSFSDEITLVDLDVGLRHQSGWSVALTAKNVADEFYCDHATLTNFLGADNQRVCFAGQPRTFMVKASYDF